MARLYGNENFPLPVVEALRDLGHDVLTIHETGRGGEAIPDADVLKSGPGGNAPDLGSIERLCAKLPQDQ